MFQKELPIPPCKKCITYVLCRTLLMNYLQEKVNIEQRLNDNLPKHKRLSFKPTHEIFIYDFLIIHLEDRCDYIYRYVNKELTKSKSLLNFDLSEDDTEAYIAFYKRISAVVCSIFEIQFSLSNGEFTLQYSTKDKIE